jgi:hypothetical protein
LEEVGITLSDGTYKIMQQEWMVGGKVFGPGFERCLKDVKGFGYLIAP